MPSIETVPPPGTGGLANLSDRAKLRLSGADRVRYLNGQVTANVTRLAPHSPALPACVTTPKGKLSADIYITAVSDALLIDAEPELRESLLARLERYIISDDAVLEDVTDSLALFHLLPAAGAALTPPESPEPSGLVHPSNRFGPPGLDFFVPIAEAPALLEKLSAPWGGPDSALLAPDLLETLRIEHGIPRWGWELGEDTLPPEAGLDRTHIDYHKGCYIGQEVISRLKSVGHVNRQLLGFAPVSEAAAPLEAGMHLYAPDDESKAVGQLTSATYSTALSKPIALGYLRRGVPGNALLARFPSAAAPSAAIPVAAEVLPFIIPRSPVILPAS